MATPRTRPLSNPNNPSLYVLVYAWVCHQSPVFVGEVRAFAKGTVRRLDVIREVLGDLVREGYIVRGMLLGRVCWRSATNRPQGHRLVDFDNSYLAMRTEFGPARDLILASADRPTSWDRLDRHDDEERSQ